MSQKTRSRKYYIKHKDIICEKARIQWNANHIHISKIRKERIERIGIPLKARFGNFKKSAKYRGIDWNLNFEDFNNKPLVCYYTGKELSLLSNLPNTISLDRIDSSKGYIKDNVVFCCSKVNLMKHVSTIKEMYEWCELILKGRK